MRPLPIALALAVTLALTACDDEIDAGTPTRSSSPSPTPSASPTGGTETSPAAVGPEVDAFLALCSAAASAEGGDLVAAETTFYDEVHEPLHALADQVRTVVPATAADLLRAKYRLELDLEQDPLDADTLAGDLEALFDAMADAMATVDITAPPCPEQPAA